MITATISTVQFDAFWQLDNEHATALCSWCKTFPHSPSSPARLRNPLFVFTPASCSHWPAFCHNFAFFFKKILYLRNHTRCCLLCVTPFILHNNFETNPSVACISSILLNWWVVFQYGASLIAQLVRICLQCRRPQFHSWVGKILWRRDRLPSPAFLGFPGGSDSKESVCNVGNLGSIPGLGRSLKEGMATHSSTLAWRIPMNRGAWWATGHGVSKSLTRLSDWARSSV